MLHYRHRLEAALGGEAPSHISGNGMLEPDYSKIVKEVNVDRISCGNPPSLELWRTSASFGNIPISVDYLCFCSPYTSLEVTHFAILLWLHFNHYFSIYSRFP